MFNPMLSRFWLALGPKSVTTVLGLIGLMRTKDELLRKRQPFIFSSSKTERVRPSGGTTKKEGKMAEPNKVVLIKEIRSHEVAIAELNNLSSSRAVYQKNGNIFFSTTVQKATSSEQKQLEFAKAKLEKLNSR